MNYKDMTEEEITYQLEWSDENEFGTNYAKFLREENKQLKEEIEEQKKYNTELMLCNSRFNAILTELEEELNIAYKELQPGELVIGQDILKNIQTIIQELKEKYK